jgi:hypothetical protein
MSRTSCITLSGTIIGNSAIDAILSFIKSQSGSVDIEGFVQGTVVDEDGMIFREEPVDQRDAFEVANSLFSSQLLSSIDCFMVIEEKKRYFNFDPHYNNHLVITINANRKELPDGTTDFNWYYKNIVILLARDVMYTESISFSEVL